eukprot:9308256-Pyramimonas_sp.AAC.1
MPQIAADPKGHKFHGARQSRNLNVIMICSDCGKYSESNVHKLSEEFEGFRRDVDRTQWRLLCAGKHPKSSLKAPISLPEPSSEVRRVYCRRSSQNRESQVLTTGRRA